MRILTIFAGSERPPLSEMASKMHQFWGYENAVLSRRSEDDQACRILDCTSDVLDVPESIYRVDSSGRHLYPTIESLTDEPAEEDRDLPIKIAQRLEQIIAKTDGIVYCPCAVGDHVDHVISRRAVEMVHASTAPVIFYRDFYYDAFADDHRLPPQAAIIAVDLDADEVALKISAFSAYRSQIRGLFGHVEGAHRYFATKGRVEEFFLPHTMPPDVREELLRTLRARVVSRRFRALAQVMATPLRRRRAAAKRLGHGPPRRMPIAQVRRLIARIIRSGSGLGRRVIQWFSGGPS